eukprot:scaffold576_cov260-Pinguiococcus_pyrenoidosus.AAC.7
MHRIFVATTAGRGALRRAASLVSAVVFPAPPALPSTGIIRSIPGCKGRVAPRVASPILVGAQLLTHGVVELRHPRLQPTWFDPPGFRHRQVFQDQRLIGLRAGLQGHL